MSSTNNINSRYDFYKVFGRYPVSREDTQFVDFDDDGDDEVSRLVQQRYDENETPDTPEGLRSPEALDRIDQYSKNLWRHQNEHNIDEEDDEEFRKSIRMYWESKKQQELNTSKVTPKGGRTKRNRRNKPSMRRKRTYVFRRKSYKRQNRHRSSHRK